MGVFDINLADFERPDDEQHDSARIMRAVECCGNAGISSNGGDSSVDRETVL